MGDARIEIKVGAVSFSGEGEGKWLSEQLDKVLEKIPELANVVPARPDAEREDGTREDAGKPPTTRKLAGTLASFLREKKAATNQVRKFLATAVWLHDHGNQENLTTKDVTKALSVSKQGSLTNASNCLANNVSKGFCDKAGKKQFYVTDEGRASLG
ncbi:MAG: hypothetical protein WAO35_01615 [Terriglobia bacterium]